MNLYFNTLYALVLRDWLVFVPTYKDRFINNVMWVMLLAIVYEYMMPYFGLVNYSVFIVISSIGVWGVWNGAHNAREMLADLEGERSITYYLTLPIPQWIVFARTALSIAVQSISICILFVPMTKIFLWNVFDITRVNWLYFGIIFLLANIFYGFFSLFLVSYSKNMKTFDNVDMRIIWPMFYLGCYQFTWLYLYRVSPFCAYLNFLNPLVFIEEGIRVATFGQEGSLPFWWCVVAVIMFTVIFGIIGIKRLQKRLDCL